MEILKNLLKEKLGGLITYTGTKEDDLVVYGILDDILESLGPIKDQLIKDAVDNIKKNVVDKIGEIDAKAAIKKAIDAFVDSIQRGGGKRLGYGLLDDLLEDLKGALESKAKEAAKAILDLIKEQLPGTYGMVDEEAIQFGVVDDLLKNLLDQVKGSMKEKLMEILKNLLKEKLGGLISFGSTEEVYGILDDILESLGPIKDQLIKDAVDNIKKNVVDKIGEIDAKAAIKKAIDAFVDSIQRGGGKRLGYGLHDDLLDALKEALAGKAKETVKAILDLIKEQLPGTYGIRDLLDTIKSDFIDKVKENLQKNVIDKLKELDTAKIAEKAIEKVMDKIKEKITYQQSFVDAGSIADAILDWVERAAGGAPPQEIQDKVKKSLEALIEAIPGLGYAGTNTTYLDLKDIVGKVLEILAHLAEKA